MMNGSFLKGMPTHKMALGTRHGTSPEGGEMTQESGLNQLQAGPQVAAGPTTSGSQHYPGENAAAMAVSFFEAGVLSGGPAPNLIHPRPGIGT